jgi:uncharacterized protein (TIGR02300 family)
MATATKAARGTKRTCQSSDCGIRFYDLGRSPIVCPECDTKYSLGVTEAAAVAAAVAAAAAEKVRKAAAKKPEFEMSDDAKPADGEEALADIEGGDEAVTVEDDETFLEEEEDSDNVSGIVSPGGEAEEEQ